MNQKSIETLEFPKIKELLKNHAITYLGKAKIDALMPSTNSLEIQSIQDETEEATSYIVRQHDIPLVPISNIDSIIQKINIGGILTIPELLKISNTLMCSRRLKTSFINGSTDSTNYPILKMVFSLSLIWVSWSFIFLRIL